MIAIHITPILVSPVHSTIIIQMVPAEPRKEEERRVIED